ELAGALADMINLTMTREYTDLAVKRARIYLVEHGHALLAPFSVEAHDYAARTLQRKGVQLRLGLEVKQVRADRVELSDGTSIPTRTAVWAGGLMAAPLAEHSEVPRGRGGRISPLKGSLGCTHSATSPTSRARMGIHFRNSGPSRSSVANGPPTISSPRLR